MAPLIPPHQTISDDPTSSPMRWHSWPHLILGVLLGTFFLIDLALPLGVASGILYVTCISLAGQLGIRWVWMTAAISSLLVLAGMELSPPGGEAWKIFSNRGLSLLAIGATSIATIQWLRIKSRLAALNHSLEQQVNDRTQNLENANAALAEQIIERDLMAQCLQQSEDRLDLVIQGSNEGIWDWDLTTHSAYFSNRFKALLGYEPDEFDNTLSTFHHHIHPLNLSTVNRAFQAHVREGRPYDLKIRIRMKSGEYRWFRLRGQVRRNESGEPVQMAGSLLDVTQEHWSVQRQTTQYRVSSILAESTTLDLAIPNILQAICLEMDWRVGAFWKMSPSDNHLHCQAIVDQSPSTHTSFAEESRRITLSQGQGLPGLVWATHQPTWIHDCTQEANFLRSGMARQEGLRGALSFPIVLDQDLRGIFEFFSSDPITANQECLGAIQTIGNQIEQFVQRQMANEQLWAHKQELERTNRELLLARDAAAAAAQAKSNFLAMMSHEIRTPLNGIIGLTEILLSDQCTPDQQDLLKTIASCSTALLQLVNNILDCSKMEAGKLSLESMDFPLRETIEEILDILAPRSHSKQVEFIGYIETSIPNILRGDPNRLRQILLNLLGNAIKFTDAGVVTLQVTAPSIDASHITLRLEVQDSGLGIPRQFHDHLFQFFHQADTGMARKFQGTGLGLAITKQLVELMGGTIEFTSEPGVGSCFWCEIPLQQALTALPEQTQPISPPLRIGLLTASQPLRNVLTHYLQSWNLSCLTATSGLEALTMIRQAYMDRQPLDVLLVDASLSTLDPWTFGRTFTNDAQLSSTRLILLTDLGRSDLVQQAQQCGYHTHLSKPIHYHQLYRSLCPALDGRPNQDPPSGLSSPPASLHPSPPSEETPPEARILLVEDNVVNQRVATRMLTKLHLQVDIANNGQEALDALRQRPYDLIFMDCQMPEMDGFEATQKIRQAERERETLLNAGGGEKEPQPSLFSLTDSHRSHVPIIALTANALPSDRSRCLEAGMDDFLSKPVSLSQLEAMVRKWNPTALPLPSTQQATPSTDGQPASYVPAALDVTILHDLAKLGGEEDTDFLHSVIDQFLEDLPRHTSTIQSAWERQDMEALTQAAHSCKGSSRTIGATALAEACYALETIGRNRTPITSAGPFQVWESERNRTKQALLDFRNQVNEPLQPFTSTR